MKQSTNETSGSPQSPQPLQSSPSPASPASPHPPGISGSSCRLVDVEWLESHYEAHPGAYYHRGTGLVSRSEPTKALDPAWPVFIVEPVSSVSPASRHVLRYRAALRVLTVPERARAREVMKALEVEKDARLAMRRCSYLAWRLMHYYCRFHFEIEWRRRHEIGVVDTCKEEEALRRAGEWGFVAVPAEQHPLRYVDRFRFPMLELVGVMSARFAGDLRDVSAFNWKAEEVRLRRMESRAQERIIELEALRQRYEVILEEGAADADFED